jgi:hypothetical protein
MRTARATLIAILLVGTAITATAGDMTLTRTGDFYRLSPSDDGLVVSHRSAEGAVANFLIPQTSGIAATSMQVGVDELTGAVIAAWQRGEFPESSIEIAWLVDELWIGPYTIAGADGTAAENPQMILDRVVDVVEEDDGETTEIATTFLHLVWWSFAEDPNDGSAYLASVPLDETGNPQIDGFQPFALSDLLPYGIGCEGIEDTAGLTHPKVFVDPQSGSPHIFATDFSNCVFQILKLNYEVVEEWVGEIKRRRHIVLVGRESMIAASPDIILSTAKVEVGHGLDVVMYWDAESAVEYVQLDENGIPPVKSLPFGEDGLTREEALEMVRSLVH